MKRIFILLVLIPLTAFVQAQKSKVTVLTEGADVTLNGHIVGSTVKISSDQSTGFIVAAKKGHVTYGEKNEDILAKGEVSTVKLTEYKKPDAVKSRKIEFTKFLDAANLKRSSVAYSYYGGTYVSSGFNLDDPSFSKPISKLMTEWGFTMIGSNSVFDVKEDAPELVLAGEVLQFGKDTRGSGFQVSTLINWSLLDVDSRKVVFTAIKGGYSDSKKDIGVKEEFINALKDATIGLMTDEKFLAVAMQNETGGSTKNTVATNLPEIATPKYASYGEMVKNSVGSVVTVKNGTSFGSGFIISKSGFLLTNNHVIAGADTFEIIFSNGFNMEAVLVKYNANRDVAMLKISGSGFTPLAINSDAEALDIGTEVIAIGTPEDIKLNQTVTKGIISGKRELEDEYNRKYNFLQTDVTINKGNSGGPLVNMQGEVIGIIAAKLSGKSTEGLGFAIPIGEAIEVLNIKFQ